MENQTLDLNMGLSEEEKLDLQKLIVEFKQAGTASEMGGSGAMAEDIEAMNKRMAHLTQLILTIDRRMQPLYEIVRLSLEKNQILSNRINAIIDSIRSGEPL